VDIVSKVSMLQIDTRPGPSGDTALGELSAGMFGQEGGSGLVSWLELYKYIYVCMYMYTYVRILFYYCRRALCRMFVWRGGGWLTGWLELYVYIYICIYM